MLGLTSLLQASCSPAAPPHPDNAVLIGTLLPFTGSNSAIGRNLEQAMLLAVEDLNAAGGLGGRPFDIVSRDSNSGSERGFNQLLELLYTDQVAYLVGPEENNLALQTVSDIEALDVFNMLPGYASPSVARVEPTGAWMRLPPSAFTTGCAFAKRALHDGVRSGNALSSRDDYNASVSNEFTTDLIASGDTTVPSVTFASGVDSYAAEIDAVFGFGAERTLLAAYPEDAATIVTEWTISGRPGAWLLGPALHNDGFLVNIPIGSLDGYFGVSPSLSLASECHVVDPTQETLSCTTGNAESFVEHFSHRWSGDVPFPAAHFYYDGVVLLAMGLAYARATGGALPSSAKALQQIILDLNTQDRGTASWRDLPTAMSKLGAGTPLRYVGAAAEYAFDPYGAAQYTLMQAWTIKSGTFVDLGPIPAACPVFM